MEIKDILDKFREVRNFKVEEYVQNKIKKINNFLTYQNLDAIVLGISGGIDSAVVLYLLNKASKEPNSPINQIMPISMPIYNGEIEMVQGGVKHKVQSLNTIKGVTGQQEASAFASLVVESLGYKHYEVPLANAYEAIINESCDVVNNKAWAEGQLASVLRTPVLYYHAAILQTAGYKSIVCGTINRDEGCYIGFFGKASDAMVDLQPIADIHKSEVYQVARFLNVPEEIINRKPKGDVWDGKIDTEMIGASYDELELYILQLEAFGSVDSILHHELKGWKNIEKLHEINKHKYAVGNPAHFIDVMSRKVKGGW